MMPSIHACVLQYISEDKTDIFLAEIAKVYTQFPKSYTCNNNEIDIKLYGDVIMTT